MLNGVKRWITSAGVSKYYTVMAVTDPSAGANGISACVLEDGDPGFSFGAPEHKRPAAPAQGTGAAGGPCGGSYFPAVTVMYIRTPAAVASWTCPPAG